MDNPENQQGLYEPPQHGGDVTLPVNPVLGGGNGNLQQNQYRVHPAPLPNVERTLREILQPQRTTKNSCIRLPEEANQFLMKSEMIRLLPVYQGFESENPYSFMRDFEDVCSAFLSTGSPLHIICLVLFPFALKEKAKIWFHSLAPNSIFTWENMRNEFLNKIFPPARTNALMRAIQNFSEKPGEPFAVVWERYKDLHHAIPHHGLDVGQICAYFHQGLSLSNKQYIQMMCAGEFYEKSAREAIQLFDTIAENARTWEKFFPCPDPLLQAPATAATTRALHRSPCSRPEPLSLQPRPALPQPLSLCRRLLVRALVQCCSHCDVLLAPSREP